MKCSCHLIHLVSSYAVLKPWTICLKVPKSLEDVETSLRILTDHQGGKTCTRSFKIFSTLNQWLRYYRQVKLDGSRFKLACVNRSLEQFEALKNYFSLVLNEGLIHSSMIESTSPWERNSLWRACLKFLSQSYQLKHFNSFNVLFQSERAHLHGLKNRESHQVYASIASDFMVIDYVQKTPPRLINSTCSS